MPRRHQRYQERPSRLDGAVVWTLDVPPGPERPARSVLPDGCMDLIWTAGRLVVAGPDTHAFEVDARNRGSCAAIRFGPGTAPVLLGVPAHELRDHRVDLTELWSRTTVAALTDQLARSADPAAALEEFALARSADTGPPDPFTAAVADGLRRGRSVASTAAEVGLGARQLHRRSLAAFGYGPKTQGESSSCRLPGDAWHARSLRCRNALVAPLRGHFGALRSHAPCAARPPSGQRRQLDDSPWPGSSACNAPWPWSAPVCPSPMRPALRAAPTRHTWPGRCATWPARPWGVSGGS
ncbi:hypothetical protein K7395_05205 [Streptomyces filamentosus]|uniref:DUF6597 domain-containing protein n=3 Tax=Streptomyces TaxID=1883 RepID=A0ABY4UR00_STRFL|nr:DUF6597 domain-containing transcriptional factor [Streptomyces filamentosus]USC46172.1 hypothetical protein K7395_05205 [Streptomyces filamentosus]